MDTSTIQIETENLLIQGITMDYMQDIFHEFTNEITTYMFPKPAERIEETEEFIRNSIKENKEGTNFQVVIIKNNNKEFIGCGGVHHIDRETPELGIWIKKTAHGNGYGKEAVTALKEWADKNLDYEYLLYPVAKDNGPSKRIPESLGGKVFREYEEVNESGNTLEIIEYRIYPKKF